MYLGAFRIATGRRLQGVRRSFQIPLLPKRNPQAQACRREVRLQIQGLLEFSDGCIQVTLLLQTATQQIMGLGVLGQ